MKRKIIFQTKVLLRKKEFFIEFSILLFYVLLTYIYNVKTTLGSDIGNMLAPYEYDALSSWSKFQWYYNRFFPFVIVIASGFAYFQDIKSGEIYLYQSKMGKKKYFITKSIAIFLTGFFCFVLPFSIGLVLDYVTFPNTLGYPNFASVYSTGYMEFGTSLTDNTFYFMHPWLYHIGMIIEIGIIVGIVSLFVSVFALFRVKYRILFFLPFYLVCYACTMLEQFSGGIHFSMDYYVMSEVMKIQKIPCFWLVLGMIMLFFCYEVIHKKGNE